jgi:putative spermidine/putrescine transport system ATP-binding protein
MTEVRVEGLCKSFADATALDDVSLTFPEGSFFGLLGPSGSGKTTLLRAIAGFVTPDRGRVFFDGDPVEAMPVEAREIGMVFQNYALFPNMTVSQNIAFGLAVRKVPAAEQTRRVAEALDLVQLGALGQRKPHELSGGQRQRVAMARAIVTKPRVLLLDEPLSALDKSLRVDMQIELKRIQREVGITTIFVTHDQEEALTLSDRVAVMEDGQVIQVDTPAGLYDRPRNRRVAGFVGTMNFFDASVLADGIEIAGLGRHALTTRDRNFPDGAPVLVAIRPEGLSLHDAAPAATAVAGRLQARQYLGGRQVLHVAVPGRTAPVAVVAASQRGDYRWTGREGAPVWLTWSPEAVTVLDPE